MSLRVRIAILATAVVLCSGCGAGANVAVTAAPSDLVLVPADWGLLADGPDRPLVKAAFVGGGFTASAATGQDQLDFSASVGAVEGSSGLPIRCGDGHGLDVRPVKQHVPGAPLHTRGTFVASAAVGRVSSEASLPSVAKVFDSAADDTAERLVTSAVYLPSAQAKSVAENPGSAVTVEQWQHTYAAGITVRGELRGSLEGGFRYHLETGGMAAVGGKDTKNSVTTDLMRCNTTVAPVFYGADANYFLVLAANGCAVTVNGEPLVDHAATGALGGSLFLVSVGRGEAPASVVIDDEQGVALNSFELTYSPDGE